MKKKTIAVCLLMLGTIFIPISNKADIDSFVSADTIYHDIKVKLIWDKPYNLDLFVTEPDGEIASPYNAATVNGGEIGYYDEDGAWHAGDSGDNDAPEIYRIENAPEGTYEIDVYCPGTCASGTNTEALVYVTLYEDSSIVEYKTFPQNGTQEIDLAQEGWWNVGSFGFRLPEDSGCFIATAVYGSSLASEVSSLCHFRDKYLLENEVGRWVVGLYYRLSPSYAKVIARNPFLKKVIRIQLTPLVFAARLFTE